MNYEVFRNSQIVELGGASRTQTSGLCRTDRPYNPRLKPARGAARQYTARAYTELPAEAYKESKVWGPGAKPLGGPRSGRGGWGLKPPFLLVKTRISDFCRPIRREGRNAMRIEKINRETHPEEFKILDKIDECRRRGHGKWVTKPGGIIECYDCGEVLLCLALDEEIGFVDCEDPAPKGQ